MSLDLGISPPPRIRTCSPVERISPPESQAVYCASGKTERKETLMLISGPDVERAAWRTRPASSTSPLIVLANRAPFRHERSGDGAARRVRTAGGLVTGVEPLLLALSGTWVAHGEPADLAASDPRGRISVRSGASE